MPVAIGHDASWTGWGWCLATHRAPVAVGHRARLGRAAWRWDQLHQELQALEAELVEAQATLRPEDPPPRVVVERAPAVYRGRKGNQAATGQGLGQLGGALLLWGTRPGRLAYPWELTPSDWRAWWVQRGRRPKGRAAWKAWACQTVRLLGWERSLDPWPWEGEDGGARADVAEAILIAVGAARHHPQGPKGPDPRRSPAWRTP